MIVAQMFGRSALVWDGERLIPVELKGRLKAEDRGTTVLTAGDRVEVERDREGILSVVAVAPRTSYLSRSGGAGRVQVVAANAEQAVIVSSAAHPPFRPGLVDRWVILAHRGGLDPFLCLNKSDLVTREKAESLIADAAIPVRHILVSAKTGSGIDELRRCLRGKTSALVGHSGVGKSSLLRRLVPEVEIVTGELSGKSGRGRHTTSSARLYPLPEGGLVIDTPGVRSVALGETTPAEIAGLFPEVGGAAPCRFSSCSHRVEPGCSVLAGLEEGSVPATVYARYRKLLAEVERP